MKDKKRIGEILKHINDTDTFVLDLVSAVNKAMDKNDQIFINECLDEWEASAELNSIPGFAKKVRKRLFSLVEAGLIK